MAVLQNMNRNEKSIRTDKLVIQDNVMRWLGATIQLSNVSAVTVNDVKEQPFPIWSIIFLAVIGFIFREYPFMVVLAIASGIIWIVAWYLQNESKKKEAYLNIFLNSGNTMSFYFSDRLFLREVLDVLENIFREGGVGNSSVCIDIKDCKFSGNAQVLNDLQAKKIIR